jgi:hypothetical protein
MAFQSQFVVFILTRRGVVFCAIVWVNDNSNVTLQGSLNITTNCLFHCSYIPMADKGPRVPKWALETPERMAFYMCRSMKWSEDLNRDVVMQNIMKQNCIQLFKRNPEWTTEMVVFKSLQKLFGSKLEEEAVQRGFLKKTKKRKRVDIQTLDSTEPKKQKTHDNILSGYICLEHTAGESGGHRLIGTIEHPAEALDFVLDEMESSDEIYYEVIKVSIDTAESKTISWDSLSEFASLYDAKWYLDAIELESRGGTYNGKGFDELTAELKEKYKKLPKLPAGMRICISCDTASLKRESLCPDTEDEVHCNIHIVE